MISNLNSLSFQYYPTNIISEYITSWLLCNRFAFCLSCDNYCEKKIQKTHKNSIPNIDKCETMTTLTVKMFIEYLEDLPVTRYQGQGPQRGHLPKVIAGISEGYIGTFIFQVRC